jgi:molecular chaperone GrpE (heat shock protein)
MRRKLIILGSVLLLAGAATLRWVLAEKGKQQQEVARYRLKYTMETDDHMRQYDEWLQLPPEERSELPLLLDKHGKAKTRAQLWQEQRERLKADLDRLAVGEMAVHPFADVLYGENWQNELSQYKKREELNGYVLAGSIVCTSAGGLIYAWWLLLWTARSIIRGLSGLRQLSIDALGTLRKAKDKKASKVNTEDLQREQETHEQQSQPERLSKVSVNSGWRNAAPVTCEPKTRERAPQRKMVSNEAEKIAMLLTDKKSTDLETSTKREKGRLDAREHSKPLNNALNDLTQQVSAIREYTAYQQDRLQKLQDGYDWNIIRTFCLRVIRCVDNLENRISRLNEQDAEATHLEEVRDELIFARESSGMEQFEPETNSEYRGQEKYAEAVKDKQSCDDSQQTGKIANVIRPGYQYFINEENIKVVRPAQVRLFA